MADFDYDGPSARPDSEGYIPVVDHAYEARKEFRVRQQQRVERSDRLVPPNVHDITAAVLANTMRGGAGAGGSVGNAVGTGAGSAPPEPQRNEPDDYVQDADETATDEEAEATQPVGTEASADETVADEDVSGVEDNVQRQIEQQAVGQASEPQEEPAEEPAAVKSEPMVLRHRDGEEIPTTIEDGVNFSFEGDASRPREMPTVLIRAIREELCRLGAPELGADPDSTPQQKTLSAASLLTALVMSALDIEVDGVDENTRRAAEVLRTGQGRVVAVETKVERVLENQDRADKHLRILSRRTLEAERKLYEMELMLTWLMVDRTEASLFNNATATSIDLTHKTVVEARTRLRDKARDLGNDEAVQRGRGRIVE